MAAGTRTRLTLGVTALVLVFVLAPAFVTGFVFILASELAVGAVSLDGPARVVGGLRARVLPRIGPVPDFALLEVGGTGLGVTGESFFEVLDTARCGSTGVRFVFTFGRRVPPVLIAPLLGLRLVDARDTDGLTPRRPLATVFGAIPDCPGADVTDFVAVTEGAIVEVDGFVSLLAGLLTGFPEPRFHTDFTKDFAVVSNPKPDFFCSNNTEVSCIVIGCFENITYAQQQKHVLRRY